jgi:hypothetical protein
MYSNQPHLLPICYTLGFCHNAAKVEHARKPLGYMPLALHGLDLNN